MDSDQEPMTLAHDDPVAIELLLAIRGGDRDTIRRLLTQHPGLERAHVLDQKGKGWRTPLHMVTDWPGYFPNGPAIVQILAQAGADPNDREPAPGSETPLHWAASSDDAEVAEALIDAGADINGPSGSIGSPIENAVGYGCWHVARLLTARGASIDAPWVASALGDRARLAELLGPVPAASEDVNQAFWHACAGGQLRIAQYLTELGADITYSPEYAHGQPVLGMASGTDTRREALLEWLRAQGAAEASELGNHRRRPGGRAR
jgi:ankyrin repeat protein